MILKQIALSLLIAVTLAGCSTFRSAPTRSASTPTQAPAPVINMADAVWLRTDGQSGRDNPALAAQFESDRAACSVSGGIERACMTRRGYIPVARSEAEATAARLRASNPAAQQSQTGY